MSQNSLTTMSAAPPITVREATADDLDAVIDLSKGIYNGMDILPAMFLKYLADPYRIVMVGEKDGRLRCLSVLHLVDDGRTIVMQAGRSDPQFKGSGSFQYMRHHGRNRFAVPRWTDVRRTRSASVHTAYWENRTDTNVLITRMIIEFGLTVTLDDLLRVTSSSGLAALKRHLPALGTLHRATTETLSAIFSDDAQKTALFPEGLAVKDSEIYDTDAHNIRQLVEHCSAVYVCGDELGSFNSISFGTPVETENGTRLVVDYFGRRGDVRLMLAHATHHLVDLPDYDCRRNFAVVIYVPLKCFGQQTDADVTRLARTLFQFEPGRCILQLTMQHSFPLATSATAKL